METTNIYVLIDPETNEVRYVGKANNVSQRYKAHLNRARDHQTHKRNWLNTLRIKKLKPIIKVIGIVPIKEWVYWENYWIKYYKEQGCDLTNNTLGGDGATFANQTSFKKGHKIWLGKNHSNETKIKISENSFYRNKPAINRKSVKQLSLDGVLIKEWDAIDVAAKETKSKSTKIVAVCKGKRKTHNNFKWEYK